MSGAGESANAPFLTEDTEVTQRTQEESKKTVGVSYSGNLRSVATPFH